MRWAAWMSGHLDLEVRRRGAHTPPHPVTPCFRGAEALKSSGQHCQDREAPREEAERRLHLTLAGSRGGAQRDMLTVRSGARAPKAGAPFERRQLNNREAKALEPSTETADALGEGVGSVHDRHLA